MSVLTKNNPAILPAGEARESSPYVLPKEIIASPDNGDGSLPTQGNELIIDDQVKAAFSKVDEEFRQDPDLAIKNIEGSIHKIKQRNGQDIEGALFYDQEDAEPDAIILNFPGMAVVKPKEADKLIDYLGQDEAEGIKGKLKDFVAHEKAGTNTWKQAVHGYSIQQFLKAMGLNVAVVTVFPPSQKAFTKEERKQISSGDFSVYEDIADSTLKFVYDEIQIPEKDKGGEAPDRTDIPIITTGESIGANIAIAVQENLKNLGHNMNTVAVRELILGKNMGGLAVSYFLRKYAGRKNPSSKVSGDRIEQPQIKRDVDRKGNELIGMSKRTIKAALRLRNMLGIANFGKTKELAHKLGDRLISGTGEHSRISENTESHLSDDNESIKFVAERGRTGHLSNEDIVLGALMSLAAAKKSGVTGRSERE